MPSVDFHILEQMSALKSWQYACQVIEKAVLLKQRIHIHVASPEEADHLDTLLWTYKEDSFLPHQRYHAKDTDAPLIQIGHENITPSNEHTLINLTATMPAFYPAFTHIIEIVFSDPGVQQLARERYKQYRDQGYELTTNKIKPSEL